MKKKLILAAGALCFASAVTIFVYFSQNDVPVADQVFQFGTVREGDKISHTFSIRNMSFRSITVQGISSSCGCTQPKIDWETIAPFQERKLSATVDLLGRNGHVESEVILRLSDTEVVTLAFKGYVIDDFPDDFDLGEFKQHEPATSRFILRPLTPNQLVVNSVDFDEELLNVRYVTDASIKGIQVEVVPLPTLPHGSFESQIVFHTNDPEAPEKPVRIRGVVQSKLELSKKFISLGRFSAAKKNEGTIQIIAPYGDSIKINSISSSLPGFITASLADQPDSSTVDIQIAASGEPPNSGIVKADVNLQLLLGDSLEEVMFEAYVSVPEA